MTTNPTGKSVKKTPVKKTSTVKKTPSTKKLGNTSLIPGMGMTTVSGYENMSAKKGVSIKKAQDGTLQPMGENSRKVGERKYVSEDGNYKMKFKGKDADGSTSAVQRRTLKGFLKGAPKAAGKMKMKNGGATLRQAPKSTMEKISSTKLKDVPEKAVNVAKKFIKSGKDKVRNTINKVKNTTVGEAAENAVELFTGYNPNRKPIKKADKVLSAMAKRNGGKVGKMRNGGSVKNISAGPSKKSPTASKVDPKGAYTKVQERTLGNMKMGGSLKKPSDDQKGLKALPTPVRNKMGYQKNGGATKMMKSGGKMKKGKSC
jgi:hypothetical protein